MKKTVTFLPIIFIVCLVYSVFLSAFIPKINGRAFAEDIKNSDYCVQITYHQYTKYLSGVYFAYEVVFNDDFYKTVVDKNKVLSDLKQTFINGGFNIEEDVDAGRMKAIKNYDSYEDFYIEQHIDGYEVGESAKPDKTTFFYKYYSRTYKSVFADIKKEGRYVNRIYNVCKGDDLKIDDDKILLCYVYGTPYGEKMISSNSKEVKYSTVSKLYLHYFYFTMETIDDTVTLNQKTPNTTGWYALAVIIGMFVLATPLGIIIIKRKKEKKNG